MGRAAECVVCYGPTRLNAQRVCFSCYHPNDPTCLFCVGKTDRCPMCRNSKRVCLRLCIWWWRTTEAFFDEIYGTYQEVEVISQEMQRSLRV